MKPTFCAACGSKDNLQHHLVTRSEGGSDESNLITLRCDCHEKLHEWQRDGTYNHPRRTKDAVPAKNTQGKKLGGIRAKSIQTRDEARAHAKTLRPVLAELAGMTARYAPFAAVLTGMACNRTCGTSRDLSYLGLNQ